MYENHIIADRWKHSRLYRYTHTYKYMDTWYRYIVHYIVRPAVSRETCVNKDDHGILCWNKKLWTDTGLTHKHIYKRCTIVHCMYIVKTTFCRTRNYFSYILSDAKRNRHKVIFTLSWENRHRVIDGTLYWTRDVQ